MREIKFRAKHAEDPWKNHWMYGYFVQRPNIIDKTILHPNIVERDGDFYPIQIDTLGQFTGLHDRNGKEIYEGDIMTNTNAERRDKLIGIVEWNNTLTQFQCSWTHNKTAGDIYFLIREGYEVIGNIHDNPELINNN